jgi:hypothetical protein
MSGRELTAAEIERAIAAGRLSPAAREMSTCDLLWQYANYAGVTEEEARAQLETAPNGLIADYRDSSGRYRVYVYGAVLLIDFDGEAWTSTLTRAPQWDDSPVWEADELILVEATGYASGEIDPGVWAVRIAGRAFLFDFHGGVGLDEARAILSALGRGDDDTDPLIDAGNVLTLPGESAIGAAEIEPCGPEDPGYPEFLASLVAVCYARGNR